MKKDYTTEEIKLFIRITQKYIDRFSECTHKYFWQTNSNVVILNGAALRISYIYNNVNITFYPKPKTKNAEDAKKDYSKTIIVNASDGVSDSDVAMLFKKILVLTDMVSKSEEKKHSEEFMEAANDFLNE